MPELQEASEVEIRKPGLGMIGGGAKLRLYSDEDSDARPVTQDNDRDFNRRIHSFREGLDFRRV